MKILSEPELIAALNAAPGVNVTRSLFKQSLRPLFELRGEAVRIGTGNRATWTYDATRLDEWREYLAVRAELIRRGTSFSAFCKENGWHRQAVAAALTGQRNGNKSRALADDFLQKIGTS